MGSRKGKADDGGSKSDSSSSVSFCFLFLDLGFLALVP